LLPDASRDRTAIAIFEDTDSVWVRQMDGRGERGAGNTVWEQPDKKGDQVAWVPDATLVHLVAREKLSLILTVDHADFETYRIGGRKKFIILPRS
jgi:hypothetical protein